MSGGDTTDCRCSIAPGDSLRLGYYPLAPGSGVRVHDATRATGRFDAVATGVDSATGAVVFRVSPGSLALPPIPVRRRAPPPDTTPHSPVKSFLPVH